MSKKSIESDLARIDRMKDAEIDYSDIPALDKSFYRTATETWPPAKLQLTIRLDADVLRWLKHHGRGYQTRINRILRAAMEPAFHIEPPAAKYGRATVARKYTIKRMIEEPKMPDRQMTSLAGELFVAAELLKRGFQTSVTFGNAKAIDLLAHNSETGQNFNIQVKALRTKNHFGLDHKNVVPPYVYVFVLLNKPGEAVRYFIVPGSVLAERPQRFGEGFKHPTRPGIDPRLLAEFEGAWDYFDAREVEDA